MRMEGRPRGQRRGLSVSWCLIGVGVVLVKLRDVREDSANSSNEAVDGINGDGIIREGDNP